MIVIAMRDGADESIPIRQAGEARQMFGDGDTRHTCGDRLELATDFLGRVWFQVPDIHVGRSAIIEDENASSGLPERAGRQLFARSCLAGTRSAGAYPVGPGQAGECQAADAEDLAAVDAVTQANASTQKGKHREVLAHP